LDIGTYKFGSDFQTAILNCIIKDRKFLEQYRDSVSPEYFGDECYRHVCSVILRLFDKFNVTPSKETIVEEIKSQGGGEEVVDTIDYITSKQVPDSKIIESKARTFARTKAVKNALLAIQSQINADQTEDTFKNVESQFAKAINVGTGYSTGYSYTDNVVDRFQNYEERDPAIPTGFRSIDNRVEGGLHYKELGMIIGMPGGGKTTALIHMGKNALMNGFNVIHYSLEMRELLVARRYDMSISEMTKDELLQLKRTAAKRIFDKVKGKLLIQEYPACSATTATIRNHISLKIREGFVPHLIIVDYDDLVLPTRQLDESRTNVKRLYRELDGITKEFSVALWTASQTNKKIFEMRDGEVIDMQHATESLEAKGGTPHLILSMNQTFKEYRDGFLRMHMVKNREGEQQLTVNCDIQRNKMLMREII